MYGTGKCSSEACSSCNGKGYHSIDIKNPCKNGTTMWNYANQNIALGYLWTFCEEVIISFDNITWKPSCPNGAFDIRPNPEGKLIHYYSRATIRKIYIWAFLTT